jgi:ADAM-TS Spacer 1
VPRVRRRRFGLQHDQKQTHLRERPGQRPIRSVPNLALAQNPALKKMNAYKSSHSNAGYNDIFLIPAGATNIFVRELNPANNYLGRKCDTIRKLQICIDFFLNLAVRNENNTFYLNGNFNINYPREFKFAGTIFHYERLPNSFFGSEVIRALGPTNESLYIAVCNIT